MEEREDLDADVEQAEKLLELLNKIRGAYEDLPAIDLADDIKQAEKLLGLLVAIHEKAENLPEVPAA